MSQLERSRVMNRNDNNDSIDRRIKSDAADFKKFPRIRIENIRS